MQEITTDEINAAWEEGEYPEDLVCLHGCARVTLTESEAGWVHWAAGKYAIADLIERESREMDDGTMVWDCHTFEVSESLSADGVDRAPCLDEDTGLAKLIWFIGPEE